MATVQAPAAAAADYALPRVTIQFCTQCKWMLRAAYYAQELLSTFSTAIGEVALQPSTGGTFIVSITHAPPPSSTSSSSASSSSAPETKVLWDRRSDGGFPETKELKRRVRDVVEPERNLGHVDRHAGPATTTGVSPEQGTKDQDDKEKEKEKEKESGKEEAVAKDQGQKECEDCK